MRSLATPTDLFRGVRYERELIHGSRLTRFMSKKELSFVPPDGTFTLLEYRVAKPQGSGIGAGTPPVNLKPSMKLTEDGGDVYQS